MTQAPEGFRTGPIVYPSPLHALTGWFRDHGYALYATQATPEDWLQRRRLFEAVMAAVPPCDDPLLSAEASRQASEAFRELGSRLLGVAYRLEAWPQAERLEALGQAPDGAGGPSMPSSMHLAGVAAWERAVAQGWDPAAPIDSGRHRESRWRRWIGDRLPAHNETNDPLTAHAVAWARTHDPEGLKDWQCVGADQAARSAGSPEAVEAAAVLLEPLLPDVLHTGGRREPLWFKLLVSHPNLWASRLEPFSPHIAAHIQPCPDEPLWTQLGSSVADRVWMAVPEPLRQQTLALCLQHGTPPPGGCLSTRGPLDKDSPYTRWLTRVLPPSWLWGRNPVFGAGNLTAAGVLENVLDPEKASPLSTAPLLAAARRHPPPDAWVPVVALAAHQARDEALLAAMAARVWTGTSWATLRSAAPARAEAVSAVEAAVAAHRLATELDAPGSDRPRLRL